jgi:hypothetical protein
MPFQSSCRLSVMIRQRDYICGPRGFQRSDRDSTGDKSVYLVKLSSVNVCKRFLFKESLQQSFAIHRSSSLLPRQKVEVKKRFSPGAHEVRGPGELCTRVAAVIAPPRP